MKVSGRVVADKILQNLKLEIEQKNLNPHLVIVLAGNNPASRIYVTNKIKAAENIGVSATLLEFGELEQDRCLKALESLNSDPEVDGLIVQYPVYGSWDFDAILQKINPHKDVDGFLADSPFFPATALGIWEMLGAFAEIENLSVEEFLNGKKIVNLGKGRTAGGPAIRLIREKGFETTVIDSKTQNPNEIIKQADVIISATGIKNIINGSNIKDGAYVIGVGVGREDIDGESKIYGDINEEEVSIKAKLYCPTIGGIGPLTIACLLENVVESAISSLSS